MVERSEGDPDDRYDWAHQYELIEQAMTLWRSSERHLQASPWYLPSVRAGYERAVELGGALLRRFTTMSELVAAYYSPKYMNDGDFPELWTDESWVDYVCRAANAPTASRAIVEDAGYFRRCRELIEQATGNA